MTHLKHDRYDASMSLIDESLIKDEHVVYRTRPHWIVFGFASILLVFALTSYFYSGRFPLLHVSYLFIAAAIFFGLQASLKFIFSEFAVTNTRLLSTRGLFTRNCSGVRLDKIESVDVYRSLLGLILNYGVLTVSGTGGTKDTFFNVSRPIAFRKAIQAAIPKN